MKTRFCLFELIDLFLKNLEISEFNHLRQL